ncbi:G-protein-signaling modulator 2 isoform X3 [Sitodiplosis mosellana]|uniref:G-protein-signaling modulator 2 isoform X3 n=1 Tax=Sitodiplosis mosellana TaxID=263140 RepID=UPI00244498CA|nr:G-protein-signaling modulator 2 isoform X3 [Sitodiplosis mosellana]
MSSLSTSVEHLASNNDSQTNDGSSMCLELALEGERLCKSGDCNAGVAFFQAAIQAGTDDLRTLSAIYSQLGNAYFYLNDYTKAMHYHKLDLTLARSMEDKLGEAKSSGNLGNTLKVMGRFDEAAICCERHLTLARQLGDRLSEGRALYNLGNVYHAKGKHMGQSDPGDFSDEVKESLIKAVDFYQQNLALMKELGDRGAQGRACGNLGNTYYLLGDFEAAIQHHQERLSIAREFGDKPAERRANSNLGNSHIFLGQFEEAAEHYKRTLALAIDLGERAVEAQACYSLGNTYTLLRDFPVAIEYHQRHLTIAQELGDKVGEARACWSLGNAHSSIGNHDKALSFAQQHYGLAKDLGDSIGEATARMNVSDLRKVLGMPDLPSDDESTDNNDVTNQSMKNASAAQGNNTTRDSSSRQIRLTPDGKRNITNPHNKGDAQTNENNANIPVAPAPKATEEDFFDMLTRTQSKRMDDQRCSLKVIGHSQSTTSREPPIRKPLVQQNSLPAVPSTPQSTKENRNALLEMIADLQSERMDEQRAQLPTLPGLVPSPQNQNTRRNLLNNQQATQRNTSGSASEPAPDDAFLDMLMRCQGSRLEEQRSELPRTNVTLDMEQGEPPNNNRRNCVNNNTNNAGATVPDEDFFSLIMRVQGGRMEDQRAAVPFNLNRTNNIRSALNADNNAVGSRKAK